MLLQMMERRNKYEPMLYSMLYGKGDFTDYNCGRDPIYDKDISAYT